MAGTERIDREAAAESLYFEHTFSEEELLSALTVQVPAEFASVSTVTLGMDEHGGYAATVALASGGFVGLDEGHRERAYTHLPPEHLRDRYLPVTISSGRLRGGTCGYRDDCPRTDDHLHVHYALRFERATTAEQ